MKLKVPVLITMLTVLAIQSCGQRTIGDVYTKLSDAYIKMDTDLLKSVYQEDAYYLVPGKEILKGRQQFISGFEKIFATAKEKGRTLIMVYKIINRNTYDGMVVDIGYYKLDWLDEEGNTTSTLAGKFVNMIKKQKDGTWKIITESHSDAPVEAFNRG